MEKQILLRLYDGTSGNNGDNRGHVCVYELAYQAYL